MADALRERLAAARLYLCVGARPDLAEFLDRVLPNGVDVVQLREKGLEARDEIALCDVVKAAAERHGALFAVNDRADLARAVGADVLHLGQRDLPPGTAREIVGDEMLIGLSSHAPAETSAAAADGAVDYFCAGPTWATPTKPGRPAAGLDLVSYATSLDTRKPWFAIGGIDLANLDDVLARGARRVVVVRALTEAADPGAAARAFAGRLAHAQLGEA
ncbi:MAG: thiamine-phosphate pyrophosphorylase [Frankiaceae bacterium]|nr:thiamine-phosphate pyrophosphorylase [Frankiaceae bacterium]